MYHLDPFNFLKKSIFMHNFICVIFQFLVRERKERRLLDFDKKREIPATKMSFFSVHRFHEIRETS